MVVFFFESGGYVSGDLTHLIPIQCIYSRDSPNDHFTKATTSLKDHFLARTEFFSLFHV